MYLPHHKPKRNFLSNLPTLIFLKVHITLLSFINMKNFYMLFLSAKLSCLLKKQQKRDGMS